MDSGYSWVICAVTFASNFFVMTGVGAFGVLFEEFLSHFSASNAETAIIISLNNAVGAFSALILGPIIRKYGCRAVGIFGSVLGAIGYGSCFFAQSIFHLCIGYGILSGFAGGMLIFSATIMLNHYFDRRRSLAAATASCGASCAPLILPPLTRWLANTYGWRTTMLAISGLFLQNCICGTLMRPPKHSLSRRNNDDKRKEAETGFCSSFFRKFLSFFRFIWKSFDFAMFRDPRVAIFIVGSSVSSFGYLIPLIFIPVYAATSFDFSAAKAALLQSIISGAMLGGRITSGVLGDRAEFLKSPRRRICHYSVPPIICGLASASTYLMTSDDALIAYCCIFGYFTGFYIVVQQPVIVDLFGLDRLPNVFSFFICVNGILLFFCQPFAGWLADISGSFSLSFAAGGLIQIMSSLFLLILVPLTPSTTKQTENLCDVEIEITQKSGGEFANHSAEVEATNHCNNNTDKSVE